MFRPIKFVIAMLASMASITTALAQTYYGGFTAVVTDSEIEDWGAGSPYTYDWNGRTITGRFNVDLSTGFVNASYNVTLPTFSMGHGSDSDADEFDWAAYSESGGIGSLSIFPNFIGINSSAGFWIDFNLAALDNSAVPLSGGGMFSFYHNLGGTNLGDLQGDLNFTLVDGWLSSSPVPEPYEWVLLIGGMFAAGGMIRTSRRRAEICITL